MIPIRDNVPRLTTPYGVGLIIVINVVVFLYTLTVGPRELAYLYHLFELYQPGSFHRTGLHGLGIQTVWGGRFFPICFCMAAGCILL